jgi:hypothetical protein
MTMKLIEKEWNPYLSKYEHTWIADDLEQLTSDFDPECATGSAVLIISTGDTYLKNTDGKWQKVGSTEVV